MRAKGRERNGLVQEAELLALVGRLDGTNRPNSGRARPEPRRREAAAMPRRADGRAEAYLGAGAALVVMLLLLLLQQWAF